MLGSGGTATVYHARWGARRRPVALKISRPDATDEMRAGMWQEAKIGEQLRHGGFARVLAFGRYDGAVWMAQELIDGVTLPALTPSPSFTGLRRLEVVARVARHLDALHAAGWVHRDIKGTNVLLSRRGPVLIDLGIAVQAGAPKPSTLCTPRCVTPEHLAGVPVDRRTDVFQLGLLLYEVLATDAPWTVGSTRASAMAVATLPPRPLRSVVRKGLALSGRVVDALTVLAEFCLQKDPAARPDRASFVADGLDRLL